MPYHRIIRANTRRPRTRAFNLRPISTLQAANAAKLAYVKRGNPVLPGFGPAYRTQVGHTFIGEEPANDVVVWKNEREIIISIRGSAHETDWTFNNFPLAFNYTPARFERIHELVKSIKDDYPSHSIFVVGHSLGGGLAQLISATQNLKAVTFNSPPMRSLWDGRLRFELGLTEEQQNNIRNTDLVTNYTTSFDPVSKVPGLFVGKHKKIISSEIKPIQAHGMDETLRSLSEDRNRLLAEEEHLDEREKEYK